MLTIIIPLLGIIIVIFLYYYYKSDIDGVWTVDTEFAKDAELNELTLLFDNGNVFIHLVDNKGSVKCSDKYSYYYNPITGVMIINKCDLWPQKLGIYVNNGRMELSDLKNTIIYAILFRDNQSSYYIDKEEINNAADKI